MNLFQAQPSIFGSPCTVCWPAITAAVNSSGAHHVKQLLYLSNVRGSLLAIKVIFTNHCMISEFLDLCKSNRCYCGNQLWKHRNIYLYVQENIAKKISYDARLFILVRSTRKKKKKSFLYPSVRNT